MKFFLVGSLVDDGDIKEHKKAGLFGRISSTKQTSMQIPMNS